MSNPTLLLNADAQPLGFLPLSTLGWKEAINLIFSEEADPLFEYSDWCAKSPSVEIQIPSVLMLRNFVKYPKSVRFSRFNVYLRDNFTCQYCGFKSDLYSDLSLDHVIPRYHGGRTNFQNIVTACHSCNAEKAHYLHMKPNIPPKRPSYYELVNVRKTREIEIPDENWIQFLGWTDTSKIKVSSPIKHLH